MLNSSMLFGFDVPRDLCDIRRRGLKWGKGREDVHSAWVRIGSFVPIGLCLVPPFHPASGLWQPMLVRRSNAILWYFAGKRIDTSRPNYTFVIYNRCLYMIVKEGLSLIYGRDSGLSSNRPSLNPFLFIKSKWLFILSEGFSTLEKNALICYQRTMLPFQSGVTAVCWQKL